MSRQPGAIHVDHHRTAKFVINTDDDIWLSRDATCGGCWWWHAAMSSDTYQDTTMKLAGAILLLPCIAVAQLAPKSAPATPNQAIALPPGSVIVVPADFGTGISGSPPVVLKDGKYQARPDGVPYSSRPAVVAGMVQAPSQLGWVGGTTRTEAEDTLLKAQSLAIQALKDRVDQLEVRLKELEAKGTRK